MKQVKILAILFMAALLVTSCKEDPPVKPEVKAPVLNLKGDEGYISQDATVEVGQKIKVGVIALSNSTSKEKLKRFKLTWFYNNVPAVICDTALNATAYNEDFELKFDAAKADPGNLEFELTDKAGVVVKKNIKITIKPVVVGVPVEKVSISLGSSNESAIGSFYSIDKKMVYKIGEATPNSQYIDIVFFKGATNLNSLSCPDNAESQTMYPKIKDWATKNATFYFKVPSITAVDFDKIGNTFVFPNIVPSDGVKIVNKLAKDQVYMFRTQGGKLGLIKVKNLYTRGDRGDFELIIQK